MLFHFICSNKIHTVNNPECKRRAGQYGLRDTNNYLNLLYNLLDNVSCDSPCSRFAAMG